MTATARRFVLIAAALGSAALTACTNPVAPTSELTATSQVRVDGAYMGGAGRDSTNP